MLDPPGGGGAHEGAEVPVVPPADELAVADLVHRHERERDLLAGRPFPVLDVLGDDVVALDDDRLHRVRDRLQRFEPEPQPRRDLLGAAGDIFGRGRHVGVLAVGGEERADTVEVAFVQRRPEPLDQVALVVVGTVRRAHRVLRFSGADGVKRTGIASRPLTKFAGRRTSVARVDRELDVGHADQELLEHHAQLEPGERLAEAEVRAEPERDVLVGITLHVEAERDPRTSSRRGSPIRRAACTSGLRAAVAPMNSVSWVTRAAHVLDRRDPAQHLFDRGGDPGRIVDEQLALVGVQQELFHTAADHVARRLVAADEDEQ